MASAVVPTAGCFGCPDVDCEAPGVTVRFKESELAHAASVEVCFDDDCERLPVNTSDNDESVRYAARYLQESGIGMGEEFVLRVDVFDTDDVVLASLSETRRRKRKDACGCDGFWYEWNGTTFEPM
jgi:hypothetical protein